MVLRRFTIAAGALGLGALAACPGTEVQAPVPVPPVSAGKVRIRVFTEPAPTRAMVAVGRFVFVATDAGLERWDVDGGVVALGPDQGVNGGRVLALAADAERRWAWVVTDQAVGVFDARAESYSEAPAPPAALGLDLAALAAAGPVSVVAAADGGAWVGTARGLFHVSAQDGWRAAPVTDAVRAMVRDRAGWLWISARGGLVARKPGGELVRVGAAEGCVVPEPRLLVEAPSGGVVAIGADAGGRERLAVGKGLAWASYRALPEQRWDAAVRRGAGVFLMGGGRVYRLGSRELAAPARPLAREGVGLAAVAGQSATDWVLDPVELALPPDPLALGAGDDQLLVGTRDLGTARYRDGDARPRGWLRRGEMFQGATTLSVACVRPDDCWLAMGGRGAWRWSGDRFTPALQDQVVLAVARDPAGPIYALHRAPDDPVVAMSRLDGAAWAPVPGVELSAPGPGLDLSFARFAAPGALWVGLRYLDGNERRPYGAAVVEPEAGRVTYHRTGGAARRPRDGAGGVGGRGASRDAAEAKDGARRLPVPVGVVDGDVRGDVAWFATNEGVARLTGGKVQVWTEADGLRSELARAVSIGADGTVAVATGAGAGLWDGRAWSFPPALQFDVHDVVATRGGQLWMATDHGIAAFDGKKVRRVDVRRGLAENDLADVVVDQFDRVWARGAGSLTLISQ